MTHDGTDVPLPSPWIPLAGFTLMGTGLAQVVRGVQLLDVFMPVLTLLASGLAFVLAPLAIGPTRRLSKARAASMEDL